ncbi:transglycosylase SLT domain-containing protein [Pseudoalteromonas tunicata]|uniref:transglycosylase SLT domain-containing protein n=1 Tax=Pseudoalteromonas tunicata TaxID=314281 RepID=UPI00273F0816|nr:transglycosylase SLT domain-containing protein [Pseudoalteromonas tunicata]MDP5215146.1 transglycosylase SLT domain-containing protein [Pseudoalteromonas tunicata]
MHLYPRGLRIVTLCSVFISGISFATPDLHKDFIQAEKIARSGNTKNYQQAISNLEHPLKPYLQLAYLKNHPLLKNEQEIERFLDVYSGTPLEWPLRKTWLEYLMKKRNKALFIKYFKETSDAELSCTHLRYQLDLGAPEAAILKQVTELWLVDKSQPKACDSLFTLWQKQGYMSQELIWQRLTMVAEKGQHSLIPYLEKQLPANEQYLADLYYEVRKDPSATAGLYRFKKGSEKEAQIAIYGIRRLVWRDEELAIRAWDKLEQKFSFSQEQKNDVYYSFALALASKQHVQAKFWLNKVPDEKQDDALMQWQLTNLLLLQDWPGIVAYFTDKTLSNGQRYWLGYALLQQGHKEKSNEVWRALAEKRDYYGFLAAARLGLAVALQEQALNVDDALIKEVQQAPGFLRAKAFFELERFTSAKREWNYLLNTSTEDEKLAAASLAHQEGWHDSVIITLAQIERFHHLDLRFPLAFEELFERYSKRSNIDLAWSYAIARRESSFAPNASSSAGAHGLMQLLPSTASYVNKGNVSRSKLYDPKVNVKLGNDYLKYLKQKAKGNEVIATASYNAGYYRVEKWLPKEAIDFDLWVEGIPYRETRDYVKNVFAYRQVYHTRFGFADNLFDELVKMKIQK